MRRVRVRFNLDRVAALLCEGTVIRTTLVRNGLPHGARLVASIHEPPHVSLVFEHESFPDVSEDEPPILCPLFSDPALQERWDTMSERRSGNDRRTGADRRRE